MSDPTTRHTAETSFVALFDQSLERSKDAHEKMSALMTSMTDAFQQAFSCANKGAAEYGLKMLEIARAHANAGFDGVSGSMAARSPTDLLEIAAEQARRHVELSTAQMKELTALAQRVADDTATPIRNGITEPFKLAS